MAITFISDNQINLELEYLIKDADEYLILISPYIKLHERLKRDLLSKVNNPDLRIIIVFGKNEDGLHKSLLKEDFEFFKQFKNIEIRYSPRLHAKYYASEDRAIFTSMNLYDYSQNNNIEVGIMIDVKKGLASIGDKILNAYDAEAHAAHFFNEVIETATLKFDKSPEYKTGLLGLNKEYISSTILVNEMDELYGSTKPIGYKNFETLEQPTAFCIRTGVSIPFNIKKPYADNAFKSWMRFGNDEYKEKYCHFTGEESYGETCYKSPILKKNWRAAKIKFGF
jgi:hypothetical protein